jgi:hypothetical protein
MMRLQKFLAAVLAPLLCLDLYAAPVAPWLRFTTNWRAPDVPAPRWTNTGRYADLLKAGQLYLSLHDAVAIATENNLDVE